MRMILYYVIGLTSATTGRCGTVGGMRGALSLEAVQLACGVSATGVGAGVSGEGDSGTEEDWRLGEK